MIAADEPDSVTDDSVTDDSATDDSATDDTVTDDNRDQWRHCREEIR